MPRDGSGVYSKPWPSVVDGTTIESAVYNGFTDDVAVDLNAVRPVIAGGTGAANATTARFNVAAEAAAQVVTNYDSHSWVPGSFRSAVAATGAPNPTSTFVGHVVINEALANPPTNANVMVEARDMVDGTLWVRTKTASVWSSWGRPEAVFTDITATGTITAAAKGHQFGTNGGTIASGAVAIGDANILLYNTSSTNWSGIGTDANGNTWFRVGTAGSPRPAMYLEASSANAIFSGHININSATEGIVSINGSQPQTQFWLAGTKQSSILDNGVSINVNSNAGSTQGMYILHGTSAWGTISDARLPYKKTAEPMAVLDRLHGVQLYEGRVEGRRELFVKAQELNKVFPQLVIQGSGPDDYEPAGMSDRAAWGVTYDRAGVVALQGLKELLARVEALEKRDG